MADDEPGRGPDPTAVAAQQLRKCFLITHGSKRLQQVAVTRESYVQFALYLFTL